MPNNPPSITPPGNRTSPPRHIVAVGGLVTDPVTDLVLLIRSPRRGWEFPGGQVEEGESLPEALVREVHEETGIAVTIGPLVGVYSNVRSKIVMFDFLCEWTGVGQPMDSAESLAVEWVTREEAAVRVTHPPLRDRLRDMLDFRGQVVYRSYAFGTASDGALEYAIREERPI